MKIFIKDGKVSFFKFKITANDNRGRQITVYAKDDNEKTKLLSGLTGAVVADITPTPEQTVKGEEWQVINNSKNYNVSVAEDYIKTSIEKTSSMTQLKIHSSIDSSKRVTMDYNENEESLDIYFD